MPLKVFLRLWLFIALKAISMGLSQNQTDCFEIKKNEEFPFEFLPESLKREESVWENVVRKIANETNNCFAGVIRRKLGKCNTPVMKITFPVISRKPKISMRVLPRPFLATKETSTNAASQILIALAQIWKLLALSLIAAAISGITIWFLVSIN